MHTEKMDIHSCQFYMIFISFGQLLTKSSGSFPQNRLWDEEWPKLHEKKNVIFDVDSVHGRPFLHAKVCHNEPGSCTCRFLVDSVINGCKTL